MSGKKTKAMLQTWHHWSRVCLQSSILSRPTSPWKRHSIPGWCLRPWLWLHKCSEPSSALPGVILRPTVMLRRANTTLPAESQDINKALNNMFLLTNPTCKQKRGQLPFETGHGAAMHQALLAVLTILASKDCLWQAWWCWYVQGMRGTARAIPLVKK